MTTSPSSVHLVTGASAGMGEAVVQALADRGDMVVAAARRGDALAALATGRPTIVPVTADVGTRDGRDRIVAAVRDAGEGPIASVVHGAATPVALEPWDELDADTLTAHFHVHVAAAIALTSELHRTCGVDRCVIFDSYSASTPRVGWSAYSILKAAAQMAFRAAAAELDGVAVARVYPGAVATPLLDRVLGAPRSIDATGVYHELNDTGRVSTAAEIAEQLLALLDLDPAALAAEDTWMIGHPA
ncbi:MAG: SDR family NAD(P)-dependent oxidoreductase [Actinomycetota bacterium]